MWTTRVLWITGRLGEALKGPRGTWKGGDPRQGGETGVAIDSVPGVGLNLAGANTGQPHSSPPTPDSQPFG